jgi:hypothetical protein
MVHQRGMIRRQNHYPALFCAALALTGCAGAPKPAPSPPVIPPASAPVPAPPPAVPIPPAPPRGEPGAFLNLSADALRARLGAPQFVRPDGATQMWRYDGASCRAFFFLYGTGGAALVRHVETLPVGTDSAADPACLNALTAARPAP